MRQLYLYCENTSKNTNMVSIIGSSFSLQLLRRKLLQATINYLSYIKYYFTPMNKIEEITRFINILTKIENSKQDTYQSNNIIIQYEYFNTHRDYIINECSKYGILGIFFFINNNSYNEKNTAIESSYIREWLELIIFHDNTLLLREYYKDIYPKEYYINCNHKYEMRPKINTYNNFFLSDLIDYSISNNSDIYYLI